MSAFIVSDSHISALAYYLERNVDSYYYNGNRHKISVDDAQKLGQILLNANYISVNHRYNTVDAPHVLQLADWVRGKNWQAVAIIKAAKCLDYQSCEVDGWEASEANALLKAIIETAIYKLAGYSEADWAIDDKIIKKAC